MALLSTHGLVLKTGEEPITKKPIIIKNNIGNIHSRIKVLFNLILYDPPEILFNLLIIAKTKNHSAGFFDSAYTMIFDF